MKHFVSGRNLFDSYPDNSAEIILGAGCFWGVERGYFGKPMAFGLHMPPIVAATGLTPIMNRFVLELAVMLKLLT